MGKCKSRGGCAPPPWPSAQSYAREHLAPRRSRQDTQLAVLQPSESRIQCRKASRPGVEHKCERGLLDERHVRRRAHAFDKSSQACLQISLLLSCVVATHMTTAGGAETHETEALGGRQWLINAHSRLAQTDPHALRPNYSESHRHEFSPSASSASAS